MAENETLLFETVRAFFPEGECARIEEIKNGNVNRTYRITVRTAAGETGYILQRINTYAFRQPEQVMANALLVTERLAALHPGETGLHFYTAGSGKPWTYDREGGFWRMVNLIESRTFNRTADLSVIRETGRAFGRFQTDLAGLEADRLYETIPAFHDTRNRFIKLFARAEEDPEQRAEGVRRELDWLMENADRACVLTDLYRKGELPLRVTHNDTKINNVLFDPAEMKALAVIDLDTVMPGLMGHDFGDAVRFAACTSPEDCRETDTVMLNMDLYTAFCEGFLPEVRDTLTDTERDTLALSPFVLTAELASRFLEDWLNGDKYFNIAYPEHNLIRARCQIALAKDMLKKEKEMKEAAERFFRC